MNCAQYREMLQEAFESSGDVMYALAQIVERRTRDAALEEAATCIDRGFSGNAYADTIRLLKEKA